MPLIARSMGWEKNPESGLEEFIVVIVAPDAGSCPDLTFADVWDQTPLCLKRIDG